MKIEINPQYEYLRPFLEQVPQFYEHQGRSIHKGRNEVKVFEYNGLSINIKRFAIPLLINKVAYTFFRPPKAWRAYHYAQEVIQRGFGTPTPIAYIICKRAGVISYSYFVSLQLSGQSEIRPYWDTPFTDEEKPFLTAFAHYTARLHEAEIIHLDYSPGNILFSKNAQDEYQFFLVDINRMQFVHVNKKMASRNFLRLFGIPEKILFFARQYALARGWDESDFVHKVERYLYR